MKTKNKVVLLALCMVALIAVSVLGTMAYLTSTDQVVNTFTVGNVQIKLDEAEANLDGTLVEGAARVKANSYKLLPGHTYNKDPMVTVLEGSEPCYVKMTVTFTKATELDAIFAPKGADLKSIFNGYDANNWIYKGYTDGTDTDTNATTRTYEFWYKDVAKAPAENGDEVEDNLELDALFDSITVPGTITNTQLASIAGMTITVNAYAIQADGFDTPEAAWAAFPAN